MDLSLYLDILKRRAVVIVVVVAVAILIVTLVGLLVPPIYTPVSTVRVILDVGVVDFTFREDYSERLLNTYREVLMSDTFLERALTRLPAHPAGLTLEDLRKKVVVDAVPKTELMTIAVSDTDAAFAQNMANAMAELLVEYPQNLFVGSSKSTIQIVEDQLLGMEKDLEVDRKKLDDMLAQGAPTSEIDDLRSQIRFNEDAYGALLDRYELARLNESLKANSISVLSPATIPDKPSNRIGFNQIALSVFLGLLGGVGLALALENLDTHLYTPQQLEYLTNLPVLGTVPKGMVPPGDFEKMDSPPAEQAIKEAYRVLIPNMKIFTRKDTSLRSILLTSAIPSDEKTSVTVNLSQAIAEQGQTLFLVEANLRTPSLGKTFKADCVFGLSDFLTHSLSLDQMVYPTGQTNLLLICGGKPVPNPTTLLASSAMNRFLDLLDTRNQFVILDSPPVLGMADASVLASRVSGVILVVDQETSDREQVIAALRQLQAARARMLGLVFVEKEKRGLRSRR